KYGRETRPGDDGDREHAADLPSPGGRRPGARGKQFALLRGSEKSEGPGRYAPVREGRPWLRSAPHRTPGHRLAEAGRAMDVLHRRTTEVSLISSIPSGSTLRARGSKSWRSSRLIGIPLSWVWPTEKSQQKSRDADERR